VELVGEQPFVGQQAERLTQGVARDTERAADGVLGEPGARREVALDDARAQDGCDPLGCARPREQCAVGGQGFGGQLASCGSAATVVRFEGSYNNRTTAGAARDRMW